MACPTVSQKYCTQLTQVGDDSLKQFPEIIPEDIGSWKLVRTGFKENQGPFIQEIDK